MAAVAEKTDGAVPMGRIVLPDVALLVAMSEGLGADIGGMPAVNFASISVMRARAIALHGLSGWNRRAASVKSLNANPNSP